MTPEQRRILEQKKKQLQLKIAAEQFVAERIQPYLEILDELARAEIQYSIVALSYIDPEQQPFLEPLLQQEPFTNYKLSQAIILDNNPLVDQLLDLYPNTHPMRYVPDLPIYDDYFFVEEWIKEHNLADKEVYLYHLSYALLLKVNFSELVKKATDEIFNFWYGDAVVFPEDYSWIIAYSINGQWRFGKHSTLR